MMPRPANPNPITLLDGKGDCLEKTSAQQSFTYGSLHALAVADMNSDGKLDIISNVQ